jgi:hypothetical protein
MGCEHGTRMEFGGMVHCFDCGRDLVEPAEPGRPFPLERPAGNFAEFLARATFEQN